MFDWISKLFGGNQQKSSPTTAARPQAASTDMFKVPTRQQGPDLAAIRAEEEKRRREEERRRKEAEAAAAKTKADAEARAKQVQQAQQPQQPSQQPQKTVAPLVGGMPQLPVQQKRAVTTSKSPAAPAKLSNEELKMVNDYNNPVNMQAYDKSRKIFNQLLNDPTNPDHELAKRMAPHINMNRTEYNLKDTAKKTGQFGADLAKVPIDVLQAIPKAVIRTSNQLTGNKETQLNPFFSGLLGQADGKVGNLTGYGQETITGAGGVFGQDWSNTPTWAQGLAGAGMAALDLTPAVGAGVGIKVGTKQGTKQGILRATGDKSMMSRPDIGGVPEAEVSAGARFQVTEMAERAAMEAESAMTQLPSKTQIEMQATEAGRIDDGISSPSRTSNVRSVLENEVETTRQGIQAQYQQTLMGLDEMFQSLTPRPLAFEQAGMPDDFMARQAEFEAPVQVPEQLPELPVPMKQPIVQAMETPNESASLAAADAAPAPAPENVVKTRTMDDMTDEEVLERFGATREEMASRRAALEAEKAGKAERQMAKENRAAEKAAVEAQASADAGDIFAGKKNTDVPQKKSPEDYTRDELAGLRELQEKAGSKEERALIARLIRAKEQGSNTPIKAERLKEAEVNMEAFKANPTAPSPKETGKDIFAGKKKADEVVAPTKEAPAAKPFTAKETVDSLFEKGGTKTNPVKEAPAAKTVKEPTPATEMPDQLNGEKPKDIFAGKKKTEEPAAIAAPTKTPPAQKVAKEAPAAKPTKEAPSKELDTDYILEKAKTGEKTRSESKTARGTQTRAKNEVVSRNAITEEAQVFAKNTPKQDFIKYALKKDQPSVADEHIARAYLSRVDAGSPEYHQLNSIIQSVRNQSGTTQGTISRFDRKNASHQEITADYEKRLGDVDLDLDDAGIKKLDKLGADYTAKREAASAAREKAIGSKSKDDIDELERAMDEARLADRVQKTEAYNHALKAAKAAEKDGRPLSPAQFDALKKLKNEIGVFQYDAVDSSLLSATGTMFNNLMNGFVGLTETMGSGKIAGRISGALHSSESGGKVYVGGYSGKGARMGAKEGFKSIGTEVKARNTMNATGDAGFLKKMWGGYKNAITTGNELSEVNIRARIQSKTYDHYHQVNKDAGLKGEELHAQSRIDSLTDPLDIRKHYEAEAYLTQGMSALEKAGGKERLEAKFKNWISDGLNSNTGLGQTIKGRAASEYAGKLVSRFFLGFPSVVWRSGVVAGAKRTPVVGLLIDATRYSKATDKAEKARIFAEGLEHAASAGTYTGLGMFLGATGIVTGSYPTDPNEQERWQAEGKTEWSIKLGNDYFDIRKSLGAFALPVMMSAQVGQNMAEGSHPFDGFIPGTETNLTGASRSPLVAIFGVTPVDGPLTRVNDIVDVIEGKKGWADLAATATRMNVPAAGFFNEIAKMTTAGISGTELEARDKDNQFREFINRLAVAVPGGGEAMGLDAKQTLGVDQTSTSIIGRLFGAQKGHNAAGAAVVQGQKDIAAKNAAVTRSVDDDTFEKVLSTMDEDTKGLYKRLVKEGKTLPPEKQTKIDDAIAGISKGDNHESSFGDEGDFDTQAYILSKKYDKWVADTTKKPEDIQKLEREVKRTAILGQSPGDHKETAKIYKKYKQISQSELKKMLDDEDLDNYDPDTANALLAMDNMFTQHGLSYKTEGDNAWTKNKYDIAAINKALAGRGGGGSKNLLATDVSGLKMMETDDGGSGLKYKTVGGMPNLMAATPKKNFKKTISIKRGVQL
jgi:hypothetical protein